MCGDEAATGAASAAVAISEEGTTPSNPAYRAYVENTTHRVSTENDNRSPDAPIYADDDTEKESSIGYELRPGGDLGHNDETVTGAGYAEKMGEHIPADVYHGTTNAGATSSDGLSPLGDGYDATPVYDEREGVGAVCIYPDVEWVSDLGTESVGVCENGGGFDTRAGGVNRGIFFNLTIEAYPATTTT